mgnify:CR=1 FL=1
MEPKWSKKGAKREPERYHEGDHDTGYPKVTKKLPKWSQNGTKMEPNWAQNGTSREPKRRKKTHTRTDCVRGLGRQAISKN